MSTSLRADAGHNDMGLNHLSSQIIKAAINVHKGLWPGWLESVCQTRMVLELTNIRIKKDGITRIVNALTEAD